ncbi:unnamed protein product [Clavelina lepadiformis]|uniref:TOM1-like protein 2 n=1 Tax=Clavelina lepadiformis TaxID=159417 RepID=A0ABP0G5I8_CLALP
MERVHSMFSNAFHSPAGQLVDKATASALNEEEWNINMEACDTINSYSEGPKDGVRAIKKRLSSSKNFNQISITLSLLETCVKNCGGQFHILVTSKEFCNDTLLKLIQPKNNPPLVLQQRVLGLIKQYAETFGSNPMMSGVKAVYDELVEKGYDFPKTTSLKGMLKYGPKPQSTSRGDRPPGEPHRSSHPSEPPQRSAASNPGSPVKMSNEQQAKLRKDMAIVNGNIKVFSEMLTELSPQNCDPAEYELLQELSRTCRAMQQRIVELIGQVTNEDLTVDLLRLNDDLNNVFLRHERFERYKSTKEASSEPHKPPASASPSYPVPSTAHNFPTPNPVEPPPSYSDTEQPTPVVSDLIDFGDDTPTSNTIPQKELSSEVAGISLNGESPAKSQPSSQLTLSEQLAAFDDTPKEVLDLGASENEIEQWLSSDGSALGNPPESENVTDEFSAFLNQRATVANQLPDK